MKVLTKDTNEQFNVRPANDYDVKNGHAITDLEILDADGNNSSAWLKADECFILTETGHKVERLDCEQTYKLEEIYDAETDERVKDMIARALAARYRRDYRPIYDENEGRMETEDDCFVRITSRFVNGKMSNPEKVGRKMAKDHLTLVAYKFNFVRYFIRELAERFDKGLFDIRNEWACTQAKKMVEASEI